MATQIIENGSVAANITYSRIGAPKKNPRTIENGGIGETRWKSRMPDSLALPTDEPTCDATHHSQDHDLQRHQPAERLAAAQAVVLIPQQHDAQRDHHHHRDRRQQLDPSESRPRVLDQNRVVEPEGQPVHRFATPAVELVGAMWSFGDLFAHHPSLIAAGVTGLSRYSVQEGRSRTQIDRSAIDHENREVKRAAASPLPHSREERDQAVARISVAKRAETAARCDLTVPVLEDALPIRPGKARGSRPSPEAPTLTPSILESTEGRLFRQKDFDPPFRAPFRGPPDF